MTTTNQNHNHIPPSNDSDKSSTISKSIRTNSTTTDMTSTNPHDQDSTMNQNTSNTTNPTIPTQAHLPTSQPPLSEKTEDSDTEAIRKSSILRPPLPPLPFHLRDHRGAVLAISLIMIIDHGLLPPVVYFGMKYGTNVNPTTIFGIITAIFGIVLGVESFVRAIKLILKDPKFRPLGQTARFGMDFWQFSFLTCLILNVACVSVGTALEPPHINLLAMPMPLVIFNLSWQLLLFDFLHERKFRTPIRMSSTPKGSIWPTFIYIIIEDVIAVDCNGKREWRQQWADRVKASKPMRETLKRLSTYWGVSGLCVSALTLGLLWGFDSWSGKEAGYALAWLLPWAWIIPSTIGTTWYVKHRLKDERHFCQRHRDSFSV